MSDKDQMYWLGMSDYERICENLYMQENLSKSEQVKFQTILDKAQGVFEYRLSCKGEKLQDLIDKMQYKSKNIKARFEPSVFADVVDCLKELQELRKDKIYTEEDL